MWRCALACLLLVGCTTGEQVREIRPDQTRAEVERTLGRPDGYQRNGNAEALTYAQRLMSGWSWDRADYHVILVDGRVTSYGPGVIRPSSGPMVGTLLIVPLGR